jgi:hypothetical protein
VLLGKIRQTIRIGAKIPCLVDDKILFHGWEGRPYWSDWSWRLKVRLKYAADIKIYLDGIGWHGRFYNWEELGPLAKKDGIVPPTPEELKKVLCKKNKLLFRPGPGPEIHYEAQILRWAWPPLEIEWDYCVCKLPLVWEDKIDHCITCDKVIKQDVGPNKPSGNQPTCKINRLGNCDRQRQIGCIGCPDRRD